MKIKRIIMLSFLCLFLCGCGKENLADIKDVYAEHVNIGSYKHVIEIEEDSGIYTKEDALAKLKEYLIIYNQNIYSSNSGIMEKGQDICVTYSTENEEPTEAIIRLGKNELYPDIDEQLIGKKTGYILNTTVEIGGEEKNVQIITKYIAGGEKYNKISDEFVYEFTGGSISTIDEFVDYMCNEYAEELKIQYGQEAFYEIIENAKYRNIDDYIDAEYKNLYSEYKNNLQDEETKKLLEEYELSNNSSVKEMLQMLAEYNVRQNFALYALADILDVSVTENEIIEYKNNAVLEVQELNDNTIEKTILYNKVMITLYEKQL